MEFFGERKRRRKSRSFKLVADDEGRLLLEEDALICLSGCLSGAARATLETKATTMNAQSERRASQAAHSPNYTLKKKKEKE